MLALPLYVSMNINGQGITSCGGGFIHSLPFSRILEHRPHVTIIEKRIVRTFWSIRSTVCTGRANVVEQGLSHRIISVSGSCFNFTFTFVAAVAGFATAD